MYARHSVRSNLPIPRCPCSASLCALTDVASSLVCPRTLHTGVDGSKDQSYFLALVPPTAFERAVFPLGHLHKTQVTALLAGKEGGREGGSRGRQWAE